ncbi:MAG TPA: fimbria/pilus outer membrane usher protein [Lelliottia sp.]
MSINRRFNCYTIHYRARFFHSVPWMVPLVLIYSGYACSREYFNPALLEMTDSVLATADLSGFENGRQAPGKYRVDVFVNNQQVDSLEIVFDHSHDPKTADTLMPCLSLEQLKSWGVNTDNYPDLKTEGSECANLLAIRDAAAEFKFNVQRLNLSIPQSALLNRARDYIPPEKWDEGINAFLLNYNLTGSTTMPRTSEQQTINSQYGNFRPGLNIGPWRIRNYSTWSHDNQGKNEWDSVYNYVSRDIKALQSQLTMGDSNTQSDVFDSIAFRGVQMASDESMTPDSLKGYAPVIHGIARTNAEVTVSQNGHSIYKTNVAPGAFVIDDMYPTGGGGDMEVTVKESDGSVQTMVVPYASLPVLHREGSFEYSITGGKTRTDGSKEANFSQLTAVYGLPHGFTVYGGLQEANVGYSAASMGLGINLGNIGAISTDITQAWAKVHSTDASTGAQTLTDQSGQSLRLRYSKNFLDTGTNLTVAGYRYSTKGYYSLSDTLDSYNSESMSDRRRNRTELSLSQDIVYGSVSVSYINENYWDNSRTSSLSLSYNNNWKGISYGFNYIYNLSQQSSQESQQHNDKNDQQLSFNISVPLDKYLPGSSVTYSMTSAKGGPTTYNVNASGSSFDDHSLNWSVQEGYSDADHQTNGNAFAGYKGRYAQVNGGYSYDNNSQRMNYGIQGGVLVHKQGVTLSQPFNDTVVLVNTHGAADVPVSSQTGVKTDKQGFAVVTYANPYHKNVVSLDTENLASDDVELEETSKSVIPTRGAVVEAKYNTSLGNRVLLTLLKDNNKPVPFGATVSQSNNSQGNNDPHNGIVGDGGLVYLTGMEDQGTLLARWGEGNQNQCVVNYTLPKQKTESGVAILHEKCH